MYNLQATLREITVMYLYLDMPVTETTVEVVDMPLFLDMSDFEVEVVDLPADDLHVDFPDLDF